MQINILGRIKNVSLPISKPLFPLFEAVINSIHAIEDTEVKKGEINIYIERDDTQEVLDDSDIEQYPIRSFTIVDNGVGFNKSNYESFLTADSTYKAEKGAKGVGRFIWLKAFSKVHINSCFADNGKFYKRDFDFVLTETGIENHKLDEIKKPANNTRVELIDFNPDFQKTCPKSREIIGKRLIEHSLVYFLSKNCPKINLYDGGTKQSLNEQFEKQFKTFLKDEIVEVESEKFNITHLRLYGSDENNHYIHYCANNRDVLQENLSRYVPDLTRKIRDENDKPFVYTAYVSGEYLDERVNTERTHFDFPQDEDSLFPGEISRTVLTKNIVSTSKNILSPFLTKIREEKSNHIERFVKNKAPQYRATLKYQAEFIENIPSDLPDEKLEVELHKATQKIEIRLKEQSNEILKTDLSKIEDIDEYKIQYKKFIQEFNDLGKSQLAHYIIHRKLILDLLSKNLQKDAEADKYTLEESVHEIIFPLRRTSDEIDYESQNLWIIDEKLAYHKYLASDIPLSKVELLDSEEKKRPDIIIFNEPIAFVEDLPPYSSIVIIEFKRPMRKDFSLEEDNPISQIYNYVEMIKSDKKNDINGRPITVTENTPFYGYVICDLTPKIKEIAKYFDLIKAPDNLGYFGYNKELKTYVEIISYDKLLSDAHKRNKVLFNKLNLPY
ncbi:MAG: DUF4263 domain-containing protein [Melioribacteraceae bacterium]|nr:DUF4263 domain-containing protein [Melioribacteraceae bacterium]